MAKRRRRKLRVMVDTNILYAAIGWHRWPHEVIRHALRRDFHLVLSEKVIEEATENVATDLPHKIGALRRLLAALKPEIVADPTQKAVDKHRQLLPDEEDVPIALAAIEAEVDYFVTEDKHFTTKDEARATLHRRLKIMIAGRFLRDVMGWTSEELERVKRRV